VRVVMGAVSVLDEDRDAARRQARRAVALYLPVVAPLDPSITIDPELIDRLRLHTEREEKDLAADLISDDILDRFAFAGDADDIISHVSRLFEAGAGRVEFGTPHGLNPQVGINLLGKKVIPALRQYRS
jgi:5,10-methylenetetrahydromethanopterin reductase